MVNLPQRYKIWKQKEVRLNRMGNIDKDTQFGGDFPEVVFGLVTRIWPHQFVCKYRSVIVCTFLRGDD